MPITVKHGEGLEGLASLVALMAGAGQQGVPQVPQTGNFISYAGGRGGGGGGGGRRGGGARRQGQVAPPGEPTEEEQLRIEMQIRLKEKQFGIPIEEERMQMEQEMKANGWKLEYTAESRKRIARANDGLRIVEERERAGLISPAEAEAMRQALNQELVGTPEAWTPPDPNTPIYPEGVGPGILTTQEDGSVTTIDKDGSQKLILRPDQTMEYTRQKHQQDMELKELEISMKRQDAWLSAKQKLLLETVQEGVVGGKEGEEIEVPKYTPRGADAFLERVGYINPFEPEVQEAVAPGQADDWESGLRLIKAWSGNVERTEAEEGMPEPTAAAQAFLRYVKGKADRGEAISSAMRSVVDEAAKILSQYQGSP